MISIDPQASLKFFRSIASHTDRDVQRRLDRFQDSLKTWLHSALNWPLDDWEADLRLFVEHSRYAGWEISPHSLAQIRELLEARAKRIGPFAANRAARAQDVDRPTIQLAAVMAPGEDTDATLDLESENDGEPSVDQEVAGSRPEVSELYKAKVQTTLDILDPLVAGVWRNSLPIIRSRNARGWLWNHYVAREGNRLVLTVDQSYTVSATATAILELAYESGSNALNSRIHRRLISEKDAPERFAELQSEAFKEAAAEAARLAEIYYGALSSLTPSGDLVVTLDDIDRNGLSLSHALILLPAMAYLGKTVKRLVLKSKAGKAFEVPKRLLNGLSQLPKEVVQRIVARAQKAKTPEEAIDTIKKALTEYADEHHIATDKNWVSSLRGGPWSPKLEPLFKKAGMTLSAAENKLHVLGHAGPHSRDYHQAIYDRLFAATAGKSGEKYKSALIAELDKMADEIAIPGTKLNRLLLKK